jgi:hypothetical protein
VWDGLQKRRELGLNYLKAQIKAASISPEGSDEMVVVEG